MKCVAIDYDGTYAARPTLWQEFAVTCLSLNIEVVTVTHRRNTLENEREMRRNGISWPIIFADDAPKKFAAIQAGCDPCVWCDDNPAGIGDGSPHDPKTQSVFEIELRHTLRVLNESSTMGSWPFIRELVKRLETVLGGVS